MLRRLRNSEEGRVVCASASIENKGNRVKVVLEGRSGREKASYDVGSVKTWDISVSEVHPNGSVELRSFLPRFLVATMHDEDTLRIIEVEPGAVIPP